MIIKIKVHVFGKCPKTLIWHAYGNYVSGPLFQCDKRIHLWQPHCELLFFLSHKNVSSFLMSVIDNTLSVLKGYNLLVVLGLSKIQVCI